MKVGILTFHAAHNYGSMLQNYAFQQVLIKLGYHPETINFRTPVQKEMYDYFKPFHKLLNKKRLVYTLMYLPWKKQLCTKLCRRINRFGLIFAAFVKLRKLGILKHNGRINANRRRFQCNNFLRRFNTVLIR